MGGVAKWLVTYLRFCVPGIQVSCSCHLTQPHHFDTALSQHIFSSWLNGIELLPGHLFYLSPGKEPLNLEAHLNMVLVTQELSKVHDLYVCL